MRALQAILFILIATSCLSYDESLEAIRFDRGQGFIDSPQAAYLTTHGIKAKGTSCYWGPPPPTYIVSVLVAQEKIWVGVPGLEVPTIWEIRKTEEGHDWNALRLRLHFLRIAMNDGSIQPVSWLAVWQQETARRRILGIRDEAAWHWELDAPPEEPTLEKKDVEEEPTLQARPSTLLSEMREIGEYKPKLNLELAAEGNVEYRDLLSAMDQLEVLEDDETNFALVDPISLSIWFQE